MYIADVREALECLREPLPEWGAIHEIPGGWSYWTFAVEPDCIFRFPRRDESANDLRKEIRLLPELAERVSFDVPRFEWKGRHAGRPFVGYRRVKGRALRASDIAMNGEGRGQDRADARERLAQTLAQLHGFPKRRAGELLQVRDALASWTDHHQALRIDVEDRVLPVLSPSLRAGVLS